MACRTNGQTTHKVTGALARHDVRLDGVMAQRLQDAFRQSWHATTGEILAGANISLRLLRATTCGFEPGLPVRRTAFTPFARCFGCQFAAASTQYH